MPELPEVETTRRGLERSIKGGRIAAVELKRGDLRFPLPRDLEERLRGATLTDIRRRAKYLLFDFDNGEVMIAHLGMSGSFRVVREEDYDAKKHDHVLLQFDDGKLAVFHDPRRFGLIDIAHRNDVDAHALLKHLGPEPLGRAFTEKYLAMQLARRSGPIKPVLMDQKLVVGVGNIYASESLYLACINPKARAKNHAKDAKKIIAAIREVLNASIASGGSTLRDFLGADGASGYFQHHFHVYEQDGEACERCDDIIKTEVMAGRSTYWCPTCQPIRAKRQKS